MFTITLRCAAGAACFALATLALPANAGITIPPNPHKTVLHYEVARFPGIIMGIAYSGPPACGQSAPATVYHAYVRIKKSQIAKTGMIHYHFLRNGKQGPAEQQLAPPSPSEFANFRMVDVPHTANDPNVWEQLVLDDPRNTNWLVVQQTPQAKPICQQIQ